MAAMCFIATRFTQIPTGLGGYIHIGDLFVFLCAFLPGGFTGAAAAGLGSALADLLSPYPIYTLPSFVIKAVMAYVVYLLTHRRSPLGFTTILATVLGSIIMMVGYFFVDLACYGIAQTGMLNMLVSSWPQALFGVVASYIVLIPLTKAGLVKKFRDIR